MVRSCEADQRHRNDATKRLKSLITRASQHCEESEEQLVTLDDLLSVLRPFCADAAVDVHLRLDILRLLEQSFSLQASDVTLLLYYRTDAIVAPHWSDVEVSSSR